MKKVEINGITYEIVRNDNGCLDKEVLVDKITDYFDSYDYIVGDYAYEKVRLKGFYESSNKKAKTINDIKNVSKYIDEYCSYCCRIFIIKKIR